MPPSAEISAAPLSSTQPRRSRQPEPAHRARDDVRPRCLSDWAGPGTGSGGFRCGQPWWSASTRQRWRHDDFAGRVVGDLRAAAHDDVGTLPGPLGGVERYLLGHPPAVIGKRSLRGQVCPIDRARISVAGEPSLFGLPLVGLHPDQAVDQMRYLPASGTVPFDDQQRGWRAVAVTHLVTRPERVRGRPGCSTI